jgi:hypothetical protein
MIEDKVSSDTSFPLWKMTTSHKARETTKRKGKGSISNKKL